MAAGTMRKRIGRLEYPALDARLEQMRVRDTECASGFGELLDGSRGEGGQRQRYRDTSSSIEFHLHLPDFRSDGD